MQEYFKILGVRENATDEEIESAYKTLKEKYSKDRFLEGEAGNIAAKNLTKLETAYMEIKANRKTEKEERAFNDYSAVEKLIKEGSLNSAQDQLDAFSERDAEWHYLQSVIFYKKNWTNESKKQLEIALNMEPHNTKYSDALTKLKQKMEFNERQFYSGNAYYSNANQNTNADRQMGDSGCGSFVDCCATYWCINMLCNGCCR